MTGTDAAEATAACKALCTAASFCKGIAAKETVNSNAAGVLLMEGASKAGEGSLATVAVGCGTGAIAIAAGAAMGNCEGNSVVAPQHQGLEGHTRQKCSRPAQGSHLHQQH